MGVKYWSESHQNTKTKQYKIACLGQGTAKSFKAKYNFEPHFIGDGSTMDISKALLKRVNKERICFIRGKNSIQSIQINLEGQIDFSERIVYNNVIKNVEPLGQFDVGIFTSPLNFSGFLKNQGSTKRMIAIGPTTAAAIKKTIDKKEEDQIQLIIADEPSETALCESLEQMIRQAFE